MRGITWTLRFAAASWFLGFGNCTGAAIVDPQGTVSQVAADVAGSTASDDRVDSTRIAQAALVQAPVCNLTANPASIVAGGTAILTASCTPTPTSYVWTGGTCAGTSAASCTVKPSSSTTYTVTGSNAGGTGNTASATLAVTVGAPLLTVTKLGKGLGTIASKTGIDCGPACSGFTSRTSVILTAVPAPGSTFAGWHGACTGTGRCAVPLDTSKELVATFRLVPFAAATSKTIKGTRATITNTITFNPTDVGKRGSVYVTGLVPLRALKALGKTASADGPSSATGSSDNPGIPGTASDRPLTQQVLAERDAGVFVLVQLTSTGWQDVANGQLIPYSNGVMGDSMAAQTILQDTEITDLPDSQFCVGYGTSANDMIAGDNAQVIADFSDLDSTDSAQGTCLVTQLPVYRFVNVNTGGHFFTISEAEKADVLKNKPWFRSEGIGFNAYPAQQPGTLPVYRFYNTRGDGYFYTIYESEKDNVIQNFKEFAFEGIAFHAYAAVQPSTLPIYRFQNTRASAHFFTIYENEKDVIVQNYNWFLFEGVSYYAHPRQSAN